MDVIHSIRTKFEHLRDRLDEATRRLWAATEAQSLGYGGQTAVSRATGISLPTIRRGLEELELGTAPPAGRCRAPGGGRKLAAEEDETLLAELAVLLEPVTYGDPTSPLMWTSKSHEKLASELAARGHKVSATTVKRLLRTLGYSFQGTVKSLEGDSPTDRDAQFHHINDQAHDFLSRGQPVISVDTKKKELVGNFKNAGREWHESGEPVKVNVHDFIDDALGKAIPYGVYDTDRDEGWVEVGLDHDTPQFAVDAIRNWWRHMGSRAYPTARELMITADSGGSNSYRERLWKYELKKFADESGLTISVCHFPPGTSKWNKIEHRMFSHISMNWRGRPLESVETIINLIANTTTRTGLRIRTKANHHRYPLQVKVTDEQWKSIALELDDFHGEWNYTIRPDPRLQV